VSIEQMLARLQEISDELEGMDPENLDADAEARFDTITAEAAELQAKVAKTDQRAAALAELRTAISTGRAHLEAGEDRGMPNINLSGVRDPYEVVQRRDATDSELRDAALQVVEERVGRSDWQESAEGHARRGRKFAEHIVRFADPIYERAWSKMVTGQPHLMDAEERVAIAVGTNAQGGFLVPTHLDPTVLLSNNGTINPYREISRVVTLAQADGNEWQGVTSAGSTASWDAELDQVSDDSPTFAQPKIPVYKGQAFVGASFEAFDDIAALANDVVLVLQDAKDRLEAAAFTTGSGNGQPTGIFTALDADTNVEVEVTTQGTIGAVDVYKLYEKVPPRFRGQGTFVANLKYLNAIRQLGSSDPNFTTDFTAEGIPQLLGKRILESSDAPSTVSGSGVDNLVVYGDFSQYVIVDKMGMSVEFIPNLFGTTNGRPIGRRAWLAHWRTGADAVITRAFALLQDGTS
jgi:HK97 family phage major capsid protein